jgi:hypothetical protein
MVTFSLLHTMAALLTAGSWLFGVTGVLIWFWR